MNHGISIEKINSESSKIVVKGFSIINGAQTTGTIGTSLDSPPDSACVLARFIFTSNEDLVSDVVRFNNSQNAVTASDFRSTDPIQRRLVLEMKKIPDAEYDGGRRGGVSAAIKRRPKLLPSYSVGQALAAVHGFPIVAYNEKSAIWSRDALYGRFFNESLTARHIVFAFGLLKAIEDEKNSLRYKESIEHGLTSAESAKLQFYRKRGSVFLMVVAISECIETIVDRRIQNRFSLKFTNEVSPEISANIWKQTVAALSGLHKMLDKAFADGLKNQERVSDTKKAFSQQVAGIRDPYVSFFDQIKNALSS